MNNNLSIHKTHLFGWVLNITQLNLGKVKGFMTWVCGHYLAGRAGSSPAGGMEVFILWVLSGRCLCLRRITCPEESSVACLSMILKPRQWGGPGPLGAVAPWRNKAKKQNSLCASIGRAPCTHNLEWTNSCTHFNSSPDGNEWSQHDLSALLPVMRYPVTRVASRPDLGASEKIKFHASRWKWSPDSWSFIP